MTDIHVVATIRAKPGCAEQLKTLLLSLVAPTHQEPGCVLYALHQRTDNPAVFIFVERWTSRSQLDAHLRSPHIQAAMAQRDAVIVDLDIAIVQPLPSGEPSKGHL